MSIVSLLVTLVVIGVVTWAVTTYIPLSPGIARLIQIIAVLIGACVALSTFGILK